MTGKVQNYVSFVVLPARFQPNNSEISGLKQQAGLRLLRF